MRDIIVALIIFGSLPWVFTRPYVGVLVWSWISYMNPHRLGWGFAYDFPFAKIVAIVTLISFLFYKDKGKISITPLTMIWAFFLFWMIVTTFFAMYPDDALVQFEKVMKIQLFTILTISVITTKTRLNWLIAIMALSIGFFGIKGGVFSITHGGEFKIWGPEDSFIEDNNHLALALLMVLPLFRYLQLIYTNKWLRLIITLFMILICLSIFSSHSRGAFLAVFFVAAFFWLKSHNKIIIGILILTGLVTLYNFMPQNWHDRMQTIVNYEEDGSAMGRINAWKMTMNVASDRLTGGGFDLWAVETYRKYQAATERKENNTRSAHSIYFGVLGEHGWPGLVCFVIILFLTWQQCSRVIKRTKDNTELIWLNNLMKMMQVSLVAYASGGAFLSLAYYDLYWHFVAISIIANKLVDEYEEKEKSREVESIKEKQAILASS